MNLAVFAWATVATMAGLIGMHRVSEPPPKATVLDLIFSFSLALLVSLLSPA